MFLGRSLIAVMGFDDINETETVDPTRVRNLGVPGEANSNRSAILLVIAGHHSGRVFPLNDNETVIASPHKVYGPEQNDLVLQLRKLHIDHLILAGMSANLCVESHLRELLEQGFEVAVVRDATAAAQIPDGDGYRAALTNFRMIANAVWTTDEAVAAMGNDTAGR